MFHAGYFFAMEKNVSILSAIALLFLGLVFVATLYRSILFVRRDHPDHVHTLWYIFSLTLCFVSPLETRSAQSRQQRPEIRASDVGTVCEIEDYPIMMGPAPRIRVQFGNRKTAWEVPTQFELAS